MTNNNWFIELDFNAAELRCLLALNDQPQPEKDIHEWHGSIFNKLSGFTSAARKGNIAAIVKISVKLTNRVKKNIYINCF